MTTDIAADPKRLELITGSAGPFHVLVLDERDQPESIADVDRALIEIRKSLSDASPVVSFSTDVPNITIDAANYRLVVTLDQNAADALVPGLYIAGYSLHFQAADEWRKSDPFHVEVLRSPAGVLA